MSVIFSEDIKQRYAELKDQEPNIRARNAAELLGVSEGELLAARVGDDVIRLDNNAEKILSSLFSVGEVMALTRNEHCVHERKGVYDNAKFFGPPKARHGLFVNPDIDLRFFMGSWAFNFAVTEQARGGSRKSLQFFDESGQAIHKIYLTPKSDESVYDGLVKQFAVAEQTNVINVKQYTPKKPNRDDKDIDWLGLRHTWENLTDTHDFHPMLKKYKVAREQALRGIGEDLAYQVESHAVRQMLTLARDEQCEIMVFVGNRGCIQIHTGLVNKLLAYEDWYNVMDPMFNLHLKETSIAHVWVTKKPTEDGIVTALEVFDEDSELIATFFGKRKPGVEELAGWRSIIDKLTVKKSL